MVPLLFNIYICDILFDIIESDIASYVNSSTSYNFNFNLDNIISISEESINSLLNWFKENHMKASADKCHLLVSSDLAYTAKIEDFSVKNSSEEKMLEVKFASNFSFKIQVTSLCKKERRKLYALTKK